MTAMNGKLKYLSAVAALALAIAVGLPGPAAAQPAKLYELVENLDPSVALGSNLRVSDWAAQGSAQLGTPFCPSEVVGLLTSFGLLAGTPTGCTITAFGHDEVNLTDLSGTFRVSIAVVLNLDNVVDAPEFVAMTGKATGTLQGLPWGVPGATLPGKLDSHHLGAGVPLILVTGGTFTPTSVLGFLDPSVLGLGPSSLSGVFRLPFSLNKAGRAVPPGNGQNAFYLGDSGNLVKVQRDEFALGWPALRAEVSFP